MTPPAPKHKWTPPDKIAALLAGVVTLVIVATVIDLMLAERNAINDVAATAAIGGVATALAGGLAWWLRHWGGPRDHDDE